MRRSLQKKLFFLKIDLPALLAIILFAVLIFFYLIPGFEKAIMERKRTLIHEMTSSACSVLEYFHESELKGLTDTNTARQQALAAIGTIRYGKTLKDYFWITDLHPVMLMHPYRPELNGQDLTDFRDSRGKAIFVDFVNSASATGESFVEYMWQWNDDSTRVVPKLSYVRIFEPWGWVIGTGIYIDDVRDEIRKTEFRAMMISGIIGLIITVILLTISRQSHRIELKRSRAEEELRKSRELYRTLAEAASEGVLIWSSQGLRANKTLLSWTGFSEEDLLGKPLNEIFECSVTSEYSNPEILYSDLNSRLFSEGLLKTRDRSLIKSHSDFSRILLGEHKAVLIVIRPLMEIAAKPAFSPDSSLIKDVSTGFFRTTFGRRNRFINATGRTLEIMGFNTLEELLPHYIDNFFADTSVLKSIRSSLALKKNVYNRVVMLRRRNGEEFTALISVVVVETDSHGIWCEGSVEELTASSSRLVRAIPDLSRYSASFTLEAPVSSIMKPVVECPENTSVSSCLSLMKTKDTGAVIITDKNGMPLGVFQASDAVLLQREEAGQKLPVTELMSSPPSFLDKNSPITEAFRMMAEISCKVIAVTGPDNRLCGMLTTEELLASFSAAPDIIISGIKNALSEEELREMFINSRKLAVSMILGQADPYAVSLYLASIADAVCGRAVELCLRQAGDPPCRFAFIHTGSAGRQEQTLLTDQDNAIIFEDLAGKDLEEASRYFVSLGKKINEMLNTAGYKLCPGNNMAGNPEWCQPLSVWKKYFTGWIKTPGPEEILKTSIFFDFRYCAGDPGLVSSLRDHVRNNLKTNDIYFHHVALAWKQFSPSESMLSSGKTNIKKILMPLTGIVRLYALKHSLEGLSTPDRITELYSGNHLDIQMLRRLLKAWKDLSSIRFSHQASCIARNKDPDNDMDFRMAEFEARSFAINAISSINDIMLKAGTDFYTEVI